IFAIAVSRNVRFRYKTPVFVEPELWNEKTNDLRVITKATKLSPEMKRQLREYEAELTEIEEKVHYLITEFPEQATKKISMPRTEDNKSHEDYWLNAVLDALTEYTCNEISRGLVESLFKNEAKEEVCDKDFFLLTRTFLEKRNICKKRVNAYNVMFRSMARYEIFRQNTTCLEWHWNLDTTKRTDLEDYFEYFRHENAYREEYGALFDQMLKEYPIELSPKHKNAKMKEKGDNYMCSLQKRLRAFWNWAIQKGFTHNNPFWGLTMCKEVYGLPYYITIEERNKVAELELRESSPIAVQRDIFVFQCLIGCRIGDLESFKLDNIVNGILIYTPHKTKDEKNPMTVRVPLSQRALDIIDKYKGVDPKGRLLPYIARPNYNAYIKEILERCEITRMVNVRDSVTGENKMCRICDVAASHMARRTFIGNAYKQVKDANIVGKMSGHVEGSKAFARYRAIDDEMLIEVINAIQ
ncbi:MAG: hypothetical protein HUJ98_03120, partial [Bacteroidaceae bacterium]|nr:hypothetical protein [Bacteroidaceae bacterium]